MTRYAVVFISLFFCLAAQAQVKKKIKKGRRNKSESQFMLDKNYLEFDWEVGHENITDDLSTTVYPNLAIRYGISKSLEVNAEINFITAKDKTVQPSTTSGIEPVMFGVNYLLFPESQSLPAVILSAQFAFPFMASKNFRANYLAPLLQANIQKPVSKKLILGFSGGAFWDGFITSATLLYNANASYAFSKKWMLLSEWFGFINGGPPQHNTDLSLTYTFTKNVQLGLTAGTGISTTAHKNYFAINGVWGCSIKRKRPAAIAAGFHG
jgi:hypothetical protein